MLRESQASQQAASEALEASLSQRLEEAHARLSGAAEKEKALAEAKSTALCVPRLSPPLLSLSNPGAA